MVGEAVACVGLALCGAQDASGDVASLGGGSVADPFVAEVVVSTASALGGLEVCPLLSTRQVTMTDVPKSGLSPRPSPR